MRVADLMALQVKYNLLTSQQTGYHTECPQENVVATTRPIFVVGVAIAGLTAAVMTLWGGSLLSVASSTGLHSTVTLPRAATGASATRTVAQTRPLDVRLRANKLEDSWEHTTGHSTPPHVPADYSGVRLQERVSAQSGPSRLFSDVLTMVGAAIVSAVVARGYTLMQSTRNLRPGPASAEAVAQPSELAMVAVTGEFALPPLPWEKDALEPHISAETIDYHYGKHHLAYVNKLNELLGMPENADWKDKTLEEIVIGTTGVMFNQAAQIWNHNFYWECLKPNPDSEANPPTGAIKDLIDRDFGSFDAFNEQFTTACVGHFGSGWVWLVCGSDGKLMITQGHDAGNPLKDGTGTPLLTCDVWEHAYYVDRRNARPAYVAAWWNLVNWEFVNSNVGPTAAMAATTGLLRNPGAVS